MRNHDSDRWWLEYVNGGHRYYWDMDTTLHARGLPVGPGEAFKGCKLAIADESARFPDQTFDGVLWVDPTRPIKIDGDYGRIPLIYPDGKLTDTYQWAKHCKELAQRFNLKIEECPEDG